MNESQKSYKYGKSAYIKYDSVSSFYMIFAVM